MYTGRLWILFVLCGSYCTGFQPSTVSRGFASHAARAYGCHLSLPSEGSCGSWQPEYIALHGRIVAGRRASRFLTVDSSTGLADRLVAAVSGLALAVLTDRAFVLTEYLGKEKDPLSDVFCSPFIEWDFVPSAPNLTIVNCSWVNDIAELQPPCTFGRRATVDIDFHKAFGDSDLVQIFANNGLLGWLFDNPRYSAALNSIGLTRENAYGCLSNFIFQATPRLHNQLPIAVLKAVQNHIVIGIQIRLGDAVLQASTATQLDWEAMIEPWASCATSLEASLGVFGRSVKWLLVTDSVLLRQFAQQRYADKLLTGSLERITHYTEGILDSAAVDNWLLGLTSLKVVSDRSSFGRSAGLRLHGNESIYTVQQVVEEFKTDSQDIVVHKGVVRDCVAGQPDSIDDLLKAWWWI